MRPALANVFYLSFFSSFPLEIEDENIYLSEDVEALSCAEAGIHLAVEMRQGACGSSFESMLRRYFCTRMSVVWAAAVLWLLFPTGVFSPFLMHFRRRPL